LVAFPKVLHRTEIPEAVEGMIGEGEIADIGTEALADLRHSGGAGESFLGEIDGNQLSQVDADPAACFGGSLSAFGIDSGRGKVTLEVARDGSGANEAAIPRTERSEELGLLSPPVGIPLARRRGGGTCLGRQRGFPSVPAIQNRLPHGR
jgi:hypothetical protein